MGNRGIEARQGAKMTARNYPDFISEDWMRRMPPLRGYKGISNDDPALLRGLRWHRQTDGRERDRHNASLWAWQLQDVRRTLIPMATERWRLLLLLELCAKLAPPRIHGDNTRPS